MAKISFHLVLKLLIALTFGQIVILGLLQVYFRSSYIPNESDDIQPQPLVHLNNKDSPNKVLPTEHHNLYQGNQITCNLTPVSEPPSLPLLLRFHSLRECKDINIPERIGTYFKTFGIFLLEDVGGQKVNIIQYEMKDRVVEVTVKIFQKWLNGEGSKPVTWATLIDILEKSSLHTLSKDIKESCENSVMNIPFEGYTFGIIARLAEPLRNIYRKIDPIDPTQNLLNNLGTLSFNLPFIMPKLSIDEEFDDLLADLRIGSRLLITGRPGVGKSTLTRYAAKMWADKLLLVHCQLLVYIPLLTTIDTLDTLIKVNTYGVVDQSTRLLVTEEISSSMGKGICLLLDSFDEYMRQRDKRMDYIFKVLEQNILPELTIIMTSRQEAVTDIRKYFHPHVVEISGFNSKQIQSYIAKLPLPLNVAIAATLEKNPRAKFMCSTPLHLTMMVRLASVDVTGLSDVTTETILYSQFLFLTFKHYSPYRISWTAGSLKECFTNKVSQSELCFLFRNICKLAYRAKIDEPSFNSTALPRHLRDKVQALSLFTIDTKVGSIDDDDVHIYYFSHKTFQEFIAACHLYMLPLDNQTNELYSAVTSSYGVVSFTYPISLIWRFFFGLLGEYDSKSLSFHFKYLSNTHRHCCNKSWPMEEKFGIEQVNNRLLECAYEAGMDVSLAEIVNETNIFVGPEFSDELYLSLGRPNDCLLINYAVRVLPFQRLVLFVRCYEPYLNWANCITLIETSQERYKSVHLRELKLIFPKVSQTLATTVKALLSALSTVYLRVVTLNVRSESDLMDCLEILSSRRIETLKIVRHDRKIVDSRILFKNLKMFTSVRSFKLECYLDSQGIMDVSEALSWMPDLHMLDLAVGNINTKVASALSTAMRSLHQLRVLALTVNPIWWSQDTVSVVHETISNSSILTLQEGLSHLTLLEQIRLNCRERGEHSNICQCNRMLMGLLTLKHLRKLEIFSSCFEEEGATSFAELSKQLTKLEYLDISKNFINNRARVVIDKSIQNLSSLKFLKISLNSNGDMPMITDGLKRLPQLQHLHLSHSGIGYNRKWVPTLEGLKFLTQLVELDLSSNLLGDGHGVPELANSLKYLGSLKYLDLSQNGIRSKSCRLLVESLGSLSFLVKIDYSGNKLDSVGAETFAKSLRNMTALTHLSLSGTDMGDKELKTLTSSFVHLTQLRQLRLDSNRFGDEGVQTFAGGLKYLTNLETLELSSNRIRYQGALSLVSGLQNVKSLEYLNLYKNRISSEGIDALREGLKHLPNLKPISTTHQK